MQATTGELWHRKYIRASTVSAILCIQPEVKPEVTRSMKTVMELEVVVEIEPEVPQLPCAWLTMAISLLGSLKRASVAETCVIVTPLPRNLYKLTELSCRQSVL